MAIKPKHVFVAVGIMFVISGHLGDGTTTRKRWNMGKRILVAAFALAAFAPAVWAAEAYGGTFCGHVKRNVLESNADPLRSSRVVAIHESGRTGAAELAELDGAGGGS